MGKDGMGNDDMGNDGMGSSGTGNDGMGSARKALLDRFEIQSLIVDWARWRDAGDWPRLLATFGEGGYIQVSWFRGAFTDFIQACRGRHGKAGLVKHLMVGSSVETRAERAIAETEVLLLSGTPQSPEKPGEETLIMSSFRFIDRFTQAAADAPWRFVHRVAVYDADFPVAGPSNPPGSEGYPLAYRHLAWRLARTGAKLPEDIPCRNDPQSQRVREEARQWLGR
jgi:SnoaL-like domain